MDVAKIGNWANLREREALILEGELNKVLVLVGERSDNRVDLPAAGPSNGHTGAKPGGTGSKRSPIEIIDDNIAIDRPTRDAPLSKKARLG